jgi:hypothetical protein
MTAAKEVPGDAPSERRSERLLAKKLRTAARVGGMAAMAEITI